MDGLHDVKCGDEGFVALFSYDVNVAHGQERLKKETGEAGALAHGVKFWSLIARYEYGAAPDNDHGLFGSPAQMLFLPAGCGNALSNVWLQVSRLLAEAIALLLCWIVGTRIVGGVVNL